MTHLIPWVRPSDSAVQAQPAPQAQQSYFSWLANGVKSFCYGPEAVYANPKQQQAAEDLTQPISEKTGLQTALTELFSIIKPYPQFQKATALLNSKLETSSLIFDAKETEEIKNAVHALARQFPQDAFLKRLNDHLHTEATTLRLEASLEIWRLYGELNSCTDERAREILKNLSSTGFFLPPKAAQYLQILETPYALERFKYKEEQKQALMEAHKQLGEFIGEYKSRHDVLKFLEDLQSFIYNPVPQLQATAPKKPEIIKKESKEEIEDPQSQAPSYWERAQTAFQSAQNLDVKQQVSAAINEAAASFSQQADPRLEKASKILFEYTHQLENFKRPRIDSQKWFDLVPQLDKHSAFESLTTLLQNSCSDYIELKNAIEAAKLHVDQQISLQLGSGVKMTRAMLGEVRKTTEEMIDDLERRMDKHVHRLCEAFGVNLDESGITEEHLRSVAVSDALKKLLEDTSSSKDFEEAHDLLTNLLVAPQKFISREWTKREKEVLADLQAALQSAVQQKMLALNPSLKTQIEKTLEVLSPFVSSPIEKLLDSVSSAASNLLTMTASKTGKALSKQMCSQIASAIDVLMSSAKTALMIEKNGTAVLSDPKCKPIIDAIDLLIPQIHQAENSGDATAVSTLLMNMMAQFKKLPPIYLYKFPLFFKSTNSKSASSAFSPFADGIKKDQEALTRDALISNMPVTQESLRKETHLSKKEFVSKTTHFAVMKAVYEMICGVVPKDKQFFNRLLDEANHSPFEKAEFKDNVRLLFFREINYLHNEGKISFLTRGLAKICYRLAMLIVQPMADRAATRFVDYVRELIINRDPEGFFDLQTDVVRHFSTLLGSLGDIYKNVNEHPLVPGSLMDKIKAESLQKKYYMDLEPKEFYKKVTVEAADKFYPNLRLASQLHTWATERFLLNGDRFWKKSINAIISVASSPVYLPLLALTWIVQTLGNWIVLRFIIKKNLVNGEYLEKFLQARLDKMVIDNEYTHAVNTVIAKQLQDILKLMEQDYTNKVKREGKLKAGSKQEHLRTELTRSMTYLFEVIGKSKNITDDQLDAYLKDKKSLAQRGNDMIEGHVIPETVNSIVKIVETTFDSFMNKDQLEQRLNALFTVGIDSCKVNKKVSDEELREKKEEISNLTDQIMELTIREAVDKKFDFSIEPQKQEINAFMERQRTTILELYIQLDACMAKLQFALQKNHAQNAQKILKDMISLSEGFKICRSKELYRQNSKIGLDNGVKNLFAEASQTTADKLENIDAGLRNLLTELKQPLITGSKINSEYGKTVQSLQEFKDWSNSDDLKSVEPIDFTFSQLGDLKAQMTQIARTCVKEKMNTVLKFFQDPLIYGMVARELVMKPFLKGDLTLPA